MTASATWLELCMDTDGGERLGRFWAGASGADFRADDEAGNVVSAMPGGEIGWNVMADPEGNEFCVFDRMAG